MSDLFSFLAKHYRGSSIPTYGSPRASRDSDDDAPSRRRRRSASPDSRRDRERRDSRERDREREAPRHDGGRPEPIPTVDTMYERGRRGRWEGGDVRRGDRGMERDAGYYQGRGRERERDRAPEDVVGASTLLSVWRVT